MGLTALTVAAPMAGSAVSLADVPDRVFADGIVGPGIAIRPEPRPRAAVTSPIAGTLVKVKPHAFVVVSADGRAVLVHLGIDTVALNGEGYTVLATEGAEVQGGDLIVAWDPVAIEARGLSPLCPVIALEAPAVAGLASGSVQPGDPLFVWL